MAHGGRNTRQLIPIAFQIRRHGQLDPRRAVSPHALRDTAFVLIMIHKVAHRAVHAVMANHNVTGPASSVQRLNLDGTASVDDLRNGCIVAQLD
jgi:hypothetical protein